MRMLTDSTLSVTNPMGAEFQQLSIEVNQAKLDNDEVNDRAAALLFGSGGAGSFGFENNRNKQTDSIKEIDPEMNPDGSRFQHHIQTKIDQIAYVTSGLLSMSFIASLYGMNLDIFTDGGNVTLAKFLYTALPFTFGILTLTFGPQYLVGRRRISSPNFKLGLV